MQIFLDTARFMGWGGFDKSPEDPYVSILAEPIVWLIGGGLSCIVMLWKIILWMLH